VIINYNLKYVGVVTKCCRNCKGKEEVEAACKIRKAGEGRDDWIHIYGGSEERKRRSEVKVRGEVK